MSITAFAVEPTNLRHLKGHPVLVKQDFVNLIPEWTKNIFEKGNELYMKYVANDIIIVC